MHLTQTKYVEYLLSLTHMETSKPTHTQTDGTHLANSTEYHSVVRALQYITLTCPDMAFVVNNIG